MTAADILAEVERINPTIVRAAELALAAKESRGSSNAWPRWVRDKAMEFKSKGLGYRRTAVLLGLHRNTVREWFKAAA